MAVSTKSFFLNGSASSNSLGACELLLPLPNNAALVGQRLCTQFFWAGPTAPPPCPIQGLSASNALVITLQP